ncbi:myc target protein 1 [Rhynchocyon petersi]
MDTMANGTSSLGSPWPENFWEDLITSFTVSVAIGLVIGGCIWALLVCLSRRRASAPISQWSPSRRSRSSYNHGLSRSGFYRHSGCERRSNLSLASLTFQRQASMDPANSFPRKSSFRASTFHPFLQSPPLPVETDSHLMTLPSSSASPAVNATHSLGRPDFHWSNHNLRLGLSTPPPPPAYESIIKAFPDS